MCYFCILAFQSILSAYLALVLNLMMPCITHVNMHFIPVAVNSKFVAHKNRAYCHLAAKLPFLLSSNSFQSMLHLKSHSLCHSVCAFFIFFCHLNFRRNMQFNISLFVLREHISSRHPCQWTWLWLWIRLRYFYRWWGRIIANKMLRLQFFDPKIPAMRSIQNHFETSETNSACLVKSLNPEKNVEHQKSYTISTSTSPRKTRGGEMKSAHTHARTHVDPQKSNRLIGFLKLFHVNCWNAANLPIGREHK